jgi:hypothetical protein
MDIAVPQIFDGDSYTEVSADSFDIARVTKSF